LERIDIRILLPTLKIVKPYLPKSIVSRIERIFGKPRPTRAQMSEIARLGESVGLKRNEIIAAIDAPLSSQGVPGKGRASTIIFMILISIIVVGSILLVWAVVDPESFPIHTYTPGTFYGTIRPQDFSSHEITPLVA
jgi:hypothetical protein